MNNFLLFKLNSLVHINKILDFIIYFFASPFGLILIFIAAVFLFMHKDGVFDYRHPFRQLNQKIKEMSLVFISGFSAWFIVQIIKSIIRSPRPFLKFSEITPLFTHGGIDSFPSGHAAFFMALAIAIYKIHPKVGIFYIIGAIIIGLARVISGIHSPLDILVGFFLGALVSLVFSLILGIKSTKI